MAANALDMGLAEYSQSHHHFINRAVHTVCAPAILFAIVALRWSVEIAGAPSAYLLMIVVTSFYLRLGTRAFAAMAVPFGAGLLSPAF